MANDVIKTLIAEAIGEGSEGMRRVAETIINRGAIRGLTPEQVVHQRAQYTGLKSPGPAAKKAWGDPNAIAEAQAAWDLALQPGDPTGGADHYHTDAVSPYWAKSMPSTGSYGDHIFYSSRPIPPGSIPNTVGTQLDTQRPAPTPATQSAGLADQRKAPRVPQPGAADLSLFDRKNVTPFMRTDGGVTSPADPVFWRGEPYQKAGSLPTAPINTTGAPSRPKVPMAMGGQPSYAGQERGPSTPSRPVPPMPIGVTQSYAGQEKSGPSLPRLPTLPASPIGQPPATRPVQSVPYSPKVAPTPAIWASPKVTTVATYPTKPVQPSVSTLASIYGQGGPTRPGMPAAPTKTISDLASIYSQGGPTRPVAPGIPDRLLPSVGLPGNYGGMTTAQVNQIGTDLAGAPTPLPRPTGFPQVGTQLSVTPPQIPPMPVPRPITPLVQPSLPQIPQAPVAPRRVAPIPRSRPQTRPPLEIAVNGSNTVQPPMLPAGRRNTSTVQYYKDAFGLTSDQAYNAANQAAASLASQSATKGYTTIKSNDGRIYDRTTGSWI